MHKPGKGKINLISVLIPAANSHDGLPFPNFWSSDQCLASLTCKQLVHYATQLHILQPFRWQSLGSLIQHFAEPFIKLTFKPEAIFGENRLLYDFASDMERIVYDMLLAATDKIFGRDVGIPLHELPVLLSPLNAALEMKRTPTQREIRSRYQSCQVTGDKYLCLTKM